MVVNAVSSAIMVIVEFASVSVSVSVKEMGNYTIMAVMIVLMYAS